MLKTFLFSALFIFSAIYSNATVYYVNATQPNNLGNGLTWANAKKDVQNAINLAIAGDSVWVATGTYLPTDYPPTSTTSLPTRAKTIFITDGVKIYGGFAGTETSFSQRNIAVNITTLSGDFSGNDVVTGSGSTLSIAGNTENAHHVLLAVAPSTGGIGVVVDGFTIQGGNANATTFSLVINGTSVNADKGGGISLINGNNLISHNRILKNLAYLRGGGISTSFGSGLINDNYIGKNICQNEGAGIFTEYGMQQIIMDSIVGNSAYSGGGVYCYQGNNKILDSYISQNFATSLYEGGSGLYISYSLSLLIKNNTISNNRVNNGDGGGIFYEASSSSNYDTIINNTINNNYASNGGGIYLNGGIIKVIGNTILADTANREGGGINANGSQVHFINNVIAGNKSLLTSTLGYYGGGGMKIHNCIDTQYNNTIINNYSEYGGGIYFDHFSTASILMSNIFWGNTATFAADFYHKGGTFLNCLLQFPISSYSFTGTGIHDLGIMASNNVFAASPHFFDSTNVAGFDGIHRTADDGLRLKANSPCINIGFLGVGVPLIDILGTNRPQGVGIDIGAYERNYCAPVLIPTNNTPLANLNICNGFSTNLSVSSAQSPDSVFWYSDSTTNVILDTGYSYTTNLLTSTDTFWVSAHNCDSVSGRLPIIVNVGPVITITTLPNDTICSGTAVTITANGANLYMWTGGISNGVPFTPSASTTYTVTATDINGCTKTATQLITVNSLPTISITTTPNDSICASNNVTITATGANSYSWSGGITNATSFIPTATNTYTVIATGTNSCTTTGVQTITINPLPTINITTLPNDTICANTSISLTATGASTYSWSGGITNAVSFTPTSSNIYTVTATSSLGCTNTTSQTITLNSLPNISINANPNDTICAGTALTLSASGASTYSWSGGITNGVSFTPASSNTYTVTATGSNSCTNTAVQSIVVKPLISPSISITPSITQGITGDPITYTATTNVPLPYSIDWYRNLSLLNTSISNTWNTTIVAGVNNIYAVIKSPTNCLSPDSAKSTTLSILNVTGVSEVLPQGFSFYPNPTDNQLTIEGLMINDKINLYNSLGQIIFSEMNSTGNSKTIQVTSYPTGNYIILFERNNQKWQIQFQKK